MYHPRIVHLCNVLEVSPSKWIISKALISLFFYFGAGYTIVRCLVARRLGIVEVLLQLTEDNSVEDVGENFSGNVATRRSRRAVP